MKINNQRRIQDLNRRRGVYVLGYEWKHEAYAKRIPIPEGQVPVSSETRVRLEETAAMVPPPTEGKER